MKGDTPNPDPAWLEIPKLGLLLELKKPEVALVDRERVIAYMVSQGVGVPSPLTAWLIRRENAYFDALKPEVWDDRLITYAVARDAAMWRLKMTEGQLWSYLRGVKKC